jgi:hypothetical protein
MPLFSQADRGLSGALRLDYTGIIAWAWAGEPAEMGALVLSPRSGDDDLLFLLRFRDEQYGALGLGTLPAAPRKDSGAVMRLILPLFKSGEMFFQRRSVAAVFVPVDSPIAGLAFYPISVAMREGHLDQPFDGAFDNDRFMTWWASISVPRHAEKVFRHMRSSFVGVEATRIDLHAKLEEEGDRGARIIARFKAHTSSMDKDDNDRFWKELDWLMPGEVVRLAVSMTPDAGDSKRMIRSYDDSDGFHKGTGELEQEGWIIESATSRWDGGWDVTYERTTP